MIKVKWQEVKGTFRGTTKNLVAYLKENKHYSDEQARASMFKEALVRIEILKQIANGLSNNEIAEKLFISSATVDSHRKNLIAKLNVKNTASLVRLAVEEKLI